MRVVQAWGDADQSDKITASGQWRQPCGSRPRATWSRRIYQEEIL